MSSRKHHFYSQYVSVIMSYWPKQQHTIAIECYFREGEFVIHVHNEFQNHFDFVPQKLMSNHITVINWLKNFHETANAWNKKPSDHPRSARTPHWTSAQLLADHLTMFGRETHTICKIQPWIYPSNIASWSVLFVLTDHTILKPTDYYIQKSLAETMRNKIDNNEFNAKNLMMSDEAHFYLTGLVNKQNCHYLAPSGDNSHNIHEKLLHS